MGDSTCVACGECVQACPTGALMPATLVDANGGYTNAPDREVDSVCPYCGVGCQLTYQDQGRPHRRGDGKDGPANQDRLCVKGRFGFDYVHHPDRLTVPLIRKEGVSKHDDRHRPGQPLHAFPQGELGRGAGPRRRRPEQIRDRDGRRALAGFGSAKGSNEEAYLFQKLVRTGFGTNNVDHCTRLCHASSVAALMEGIGSGAVTAPFTAAADADVIIVIGANPTENHPVAATFFKQAAKRGAKLIVMDPRGQRLTRHATRDAALQARPRRGDAERDDPHDHRGGAVRPAIRRRPIPRISRSCASTSATTRPEAMAPICGIDAGDLRHVARIYARAEAAIIFWGMGISQHIHGTDNARCLIALALITGQVGRPGTGLHPLRGQNNVQGASDAGLIPMVFPDYQPVDNPESARTSRRCGRRPLDASAG